MGASQGFGKGKWGDKTAVVAALIRKRTGVRDRSEERLGVGHEGNVARPIRSVNEYQSWKSRLANLEAMLASRDPNDTPKFRRPNISPENFQKKYPWQGGAESNFRD